MLKICEIFQSIQGESSLQGFPTVFIRLSGCNLDCSYCDTRYASDGGEYMSVEQVLGAVYEYPASHVCITGGEPLYQEETALLVRKLLEMDLTVSVETNGSYDVSVLPEKALKIIDIKCPGSGESESLCHANLHCSGAATEYKFVLGSREDFDYAISILGQFNLDSARAVLFSPVTDRLDPALLAEWILAEAPMVRLQFQLHRIIWPEDSRGR